MDIKEQLCEANWDYKLAEGEYYGYFYLSKYLLQLASENTDDNQADLLQCLARLCSLDFNLNDSSNPYNSEQIQEFVASQTQQLADIIDYISEPLLKNRVGDILWLYHTPRDINVNTPFAIVITNEYGHQFLPLTRDAPITILMIDVVPCSKATR